MTGKLLYLLALGYPDYTLLAEPQSDYVADKDEYYTGVSKDEAQLQYVPAPAFYCAANKVDTEHQKQQDEPVGLEYVSQLEKLQERRKAFSVASDVFLRKLILDYERTQHTG